jgi:hypothetical protein
MLESPSMTNLPDDRALSAGAQSSAPIPDGEFVASLRVAIERYLGAVDQWEKGYQKYYRMPGQAAKITADLESEHRDYCARRRELEAMLPRARRLCLKHQVRDGFHGLLRIDLGRYAPQHRVDSAIGRNERNDVTRCLLELNGACQEWEMEPNATFDQPEPEKGSLLRRLVNFFY